MEDGREYNLNLSYEKIIKPTLNKMNIEFIRADEIMMAEIIDESMYRLLLCADLVVADITTLNPNALYELGVRYALKPYSTIIISDKSTKFPFDLNHLRIFTYEHNGTYICDKECIRLQKSLCVVITNIQNSSNQYIDSPIYKYLPELTPPTYPSDINYFQEATKRFRASDNLCNLVNLAYKKRDNGDFKTAAELYKKALLISKDDYIIKEIAVCIYQEDTIEALMKALKFLKENIDVKTTTNPEILKSMGTIFKRLWMKNKQKEYAVESLSYYERSFILYHSYNSGLNYGLMLFVVSTYHNGEEANQYQHWARKTYQQTMQICLSCYSPTDYWINASLEECCLALDRVDEYDRYKKIAEFCIQTESGSFEWKRKKTLEQLDVLSQIRKISK